MRVSQLRLAAVALTSGILLGGCAYDMYGGDYGYGYGPYGYSYPRSGVSIGIGYGGGYGGYGYGYPYGGYYGGYGYPYGGYYGGYNPFGWYGNYYYPGSGIYVYDVNRTRHVWSGDQQRYWTQRRQQWQSRGGTTSTRENWSGWDRHRRDRDGSATTSGTWTRGPRNWTRTNVQSQSSTSTSSDGSQRRGRGHRGDRDD
jgi:hypothetical protein